MNGASTAAASLMHQTNANGVQQVAMPPTSTSGSDPNAIIAAPSLYDKLLSFLCCYTPSDTQNNNAIIKSPLLPTMLQEDTNKICLILDLDETLVHSTFKPIPNPDFVLPVDIEGSIHHIYVLKRPGVDEFLEKLGKTFEIVVYTASLSKYADPLLDLLDIHKVIRHRLFRESCTLHEGAYVKDLTKVGRDLKKTIIVDNSPASYLFQPENAIGISTYIDDPSDRELYYCLNFLQMIQDKDNVFDHLQKYHSYIEKIADEYIQSVQ